MQKAALPDEDIAGIVDWFIETLRTLTGDHVLSVPYTFYLLFAASISVRSRCLHDALTLPRNSLKRE